MASPPAFDPLVQVTAAQDIYPLASAVGLGSGSSTCQRTLGADGGQAARIASGHIVECVERRGREQVGISGRLNKRVVVRVRQERRRTRPWSLTAVQILARELGHRQARIWPVALGGRIRQPASRRTRGRCRHRGCCPSFNLPVQTGAAANYDAQAAVVTSANVLPARSWLVVLDQGAVELRTFDADCLPPEALGGSNVGGLVDAHPED